MSNVKLPGSDIEVDERSLTPDEREALSADPRESMREEQEERQMSKTKTQRRARDFRARPKAARELRGEQGDDLVTVVLHGGRADDAIAAVCVDLDRGHAVAGAWAALVRRDRVEDLLERTGATLAREPAAWDGSRFGDGSGTVTRDGDGSVVGDGLNGGALCP